jgi:hypothetical protein
MAIISDGASKDKQLLAAEFAPYLRLYRVAELGDASLTLAAYIYFAELKNKTCWASDKSIAELVGVSVSAVKSHTLLLLQKKYLTFLGTNDKGMPEYKVSDVFKVENDKEQYFPLPQQLAGNRTIPHSCKKIYAATVLRAGILNGGVETDKGAERFAEDTGIASRQVWRVVRQLQEMKLIDRKVNAAKNKSTIRPLPPSSYTPLSKDDIASNCQTDRLSAWQSDKGSGLSDCQNASLSLTKPRNVTDIESYKTEQKQNQETEQQQTEPAVGVAALPNVQEEGAGDNSLANGIDFPAIGERLQSLAGASELLQLKDECLSILASAVSAEISKNPASEECSAPQIYQYLKERNNPEHSAVLNWFGTLRAFLRTAQALKAEDWIFNSSRSAPFFSVRIETIREALQPFAKAEQVRNDSKLCAECGKKPGAFKNPLDQLVCYNPWVSRPAFCNQKLADENERRAIDLAREQLLAGVENTVHPNIFAKVVRYAVEVVQKDQWLRWKDNCDEHIELSEVAGDSVAVKQRVLEAFQKLPPQGQAAFE